jgi:4-hydroxy-tetrahydrodipicolinate synthase
VKAKLELAKGSSLEFYDAHSPNTMLSLQHGARGMSCIAGNFYPEIFVWMCNNVNDPGKQEEVKWLQSEITRVDAIISDGYPLSSKYFLKKRGLPIELVCRAENSGLSKTQMEALDKVYQDLSAWRQRLGIVM